MQDPRHFPTCARLYARYRPTYPAQLFNQLAKLATHRSVAWDCGTGSGQAATLLAPHFKQVIATDANVSQLRHASAADGVSYVASRAEAVCLGDATADCVVTAQAIHWFQLDAYYAEVKRVAKEGAIVCVMGYGRASIAGPPDEVLQDLYHEMFELHFSEQRKHVEDGYKSLPFPFDELSPIPFTIEVRWRLDDLVGYVRSWSSVEQHIHQGGSDPSARMREALGAVWDADEYRTVRFPGFMRLGRHGDLTI